MKSMVLWKFHAWKILITFIRPFTLESRDGFRRIWMAPMVLEQKNKSISTDLMQYNVVVVKGFPARRVPSCFSCPMFSVLLSVLFTIEFLDRCNFRLGHSGALKCKRFNYTGLSGGWLCWKSFELGQLWPACQKHNLLSEGTLWKRKKLFRRPWGQLKPFLKEWMYHHGPKSFQTHPLFRYSLGTCGFIQLCFPIRSMLPFVWSKHKSIWSMSTHKRQLCGGASSSSKARLVAVKHSEST